MAGLDFRLGHFDGREPLIDLRFHARDRGLVGMHLRLAGARGHFLRLVVRLRDHAFELFRALPFDEIQILADFILRQIGLGLFELRAVLRQHRFALRLRRDVDVVLGLRLVQRGRVRRGIDREERLPGLHVGAFREIDFHDPARRLRADRHGFGRDAAPDLIDVNGHVSCRHERGCDGGRRRWRRRRRGRFFLAVGRKRQRGETEQHDRCRTAFIHEFHCTSFVVSVYLLTGSLKRNQPAESKPNALGL